MKIYDKLVRDRIPEIIEASGKKCDIEVVSDDVTLDYLYKGGRCSSLVFIFGKGLHIRPIIRVTDGKMAVYKKPRGKMIKALNELLQIFKDDLANIELDKVMLTHSLAPESMEYLKQELLKLIPEDKLMITEAGSIVSAHCGKGTIGILYIVK